MVTFTKLTRGASRLVLITLLAVMTLASSQVSRVKFSGQISPK